MSSFVSPSATVGARQSRSTSSADRGVELIAGNSAVYEPPCRGFLTGDLLPEQEHLLGARHAGQAGQQP